MMLDQEHIGVVVVMEKKVVSGLAKLATRHRWTLIHMPTAAEVMKTMGRARVDIAVVHIAVDSRQTVDLIRWLRLTRRDVLLIATTSAHQEDLERMVRHAGAHFYLPQTDEVSLERAVADLLRQESARAGFDMTDHAHREEHYRRTAGRAAATRGA